MFYLFEVSLCVKKFMQLVKEKHNWSHFLRLELFSIFFFKGISYVCLKSSKSGITSLHQLFKRWIVLST